ncbi:type I restriction enzyme S subunit [Desulfobotulus alkaliphilus]|uniref:Type I restriction enzyme S subunit n=1 Tax=Desulfobotulus alkaliphilus TaxID=622671 RepID=A0A562QYU8_9BACT|nr:restriction endonuclease subunit S [Desulfobotulus alkaliphilus]TWI61753.1 type I restriction enzyme S subunit [Desulfobotulus alkaliphilus]
MKTQLLLKQARVSLIPHGWQISQVGKSCSIRNDLRKPISLEERSSIQGDYPYYGPTGILDYIDQYLLDGEFALIGEDGDHFLKPKEKPQTILAKGKFNVNNHAHVIASTNVCSAEWFATFYKHRNITDFLSRQGANRYKLNKATLEKLPILLPPLPEQKAIAALLSTWDEAIEKTERLIQAKEKRFKWLLRELISEQPKTQKNAKWKKVKLGDLFGKEVNVEKGKALTKESNTEGDVPVVAGGQTYAYFTNHSTHEIPTVTVSASGAYAGFVWYHDYPIWASDCNVLRATKGITKFLYFTLKEMQHRVYALQSGGAQPHVYSKDMKNLQIYWPQVEEQKEIAKILSNVQHEINLLKQLAEQYKTQKRGLMQKMLTGQWRAKPDIVMGDA